MTSDPESLGGIPSPSARAFGSMPPFFLFFAMDFSSDLYRRMCWCLAHSSTDNKQCPPGVHVPCKERHNWTESLNRDISKATVMAIFVAFMF